MAQEDDLRALGKIMDFLRAVSIILAIMNVYWYCYEAMHIWGVTIGVVDRILINFNRTGGLFHSILYTKLFSLLLLALSCLGTKGVKAEKMSWNRIWTVLVVGSCLFFLNCENSQPTTPYSKSTGKQEESSTKSRTEVRFRPQTVETYPVRENPISPRKITATAPTGTTPGLPSLRRHLNSVPSRTQRHTETPRLGDRRSRPPSPPTTYGGTLPFPHNRPTTAV